MKKKLALLVTIIVCLGIMLTLYAVNTNAAVTVTSNQTGTHDGYYYSFWNQGGGSVVMTLGNGGNYSVNWSNCSNFTCGKGWQTGSANKVVGFSGSFNGGNNGYLALYGWTKNPLIEYYVIENYGQWTPPGSSSQGTMTSDGGTYNLHKMQRVNQPSIVGTATFDQFFSVRTSKRSSGNVTFANHANAWRNKGWNLGSTWDYLIMESEGYQSSGSANITVSDGTTNTNNNTNTNTNTNTDYGTRSAFSTIQAEQYSSTTSSTLQSFDNGSGGTSVGYIESGNTITYKNIDFGNGAASISTVVASEQNTNIEVR